jgi:hypothetical protein
VLDAFYTGPAKLIFKNDPPSPLFTHTHTHNEQTVSCISISEGTVIKKLVKAIEHADQQLTFWQYASGL